MLRVDRVRGYIFQHGLLGVQGVLVLGKIADPGVRGDEGDVYKRQSLPFEHPPNMDAPSDAAKKIANVLFFIVIPSN